MPGDPPPEWRGGLMEEKIEEGGGILDIRKVVMGYDSDVVEYDGRR